MVYVISFTSESITTPEFTLIHGANIYKDTKP